MKNKYTEIIEQLTDSELLFHLYATQALLFVLSLGFGLLFFHGFSFLEFFKWDNWQVITIGVTAGLIVVMIDLLLMRLLPPSYYYDGGLNERIFKNKHIFYIAWIAFIVSCSEELLFRGVIQMKFGLIFASIVFAVIHYRYLFNWFLFLNIILLSFFIGVIFSWTNNLAVTIAMHFTIDFLLGIYIKWKNSKNENEEEGLFNE
ncbi:MAG: type II CAAX endopeptidase family protein [Bacillota bacterium]|nr:type II CAAX endopeptidase family protein [Bacillota bacterium]